MEYDLYQLEWEKKATVRSFPRILFEKEHAGYFYPMSRQPLCLHPVVENLGGEAMNYLLTQSFYKYTNDIAVIETKIVNQSILKVTSNTLPIAFSNEHKLNLYTIMIDEAYHAYVAYDAMLQVQEHTGITPLPLPETIEIELAIHKIKTKLDLKYHDLFELIAVCLAENTLTKELVTMLDQDETHPFFETHIKNHLADESKHSGIFFHLLNYIWINTPDNYKREIGKILPQFLSLYLGLSVQKKFDKSVLIELGLTKKAADQVIHDTYSGYQVTKYHPMLKNILNVLSKVGILDEIDWDV